jgi:hypothetical protein
MSDPSEGTGDGVAAAPTSETASKVALAALLGLVVVSPWPFGSVPLRATQVVAVLSLALSLVLWRRSVRVPHALAWALLALCALAVLQLVPVPRVLHATLAPGSATIWYPSDPAPARVLGEGPHPLSVFPAATARFLALATGVGALALLSTTSLGDRHRALRASMVVVGGGVAVALYGLVARFACGNKLYCMFPVSTTAPFGPFVSKNHYAGYVEMAALLALGIATGLTDEARTRPGSLSWIESPRAGRILLAWTVPVALILAVPASLSRGGVLSLGAGLATFVILRWQQVRRDRSRKRLALALGALALVAAAIALVLPRAALARVLTIVTTSPDASGSYRLEIWRDSLRLLASSPIVGSGFGAYGDAVARLKTAAGDVRVDHAENDYLEALGEGGVAAGLLFIAFAWTIVARGWRSIRDEPHRGPRALRTGALAGIVALLVHSAFDFNLRVPANALLFALLVALVMGPVDPPLRVPRLLGPAAARLVLAVSLALALATPWTEGAAVEDLARRAGTLPEGLRWAAVEHEIVSHLRRRPADAAAWVTLAWLRRPSSPADASALARWGVGLDPRREALRRTAPGF